MAFDWTAIGPCRYPDIRPRRPVYLSGSVNSGLRWLEQHGYDVGVLTTPESAYPDATVVRFRAWGADNAIYSVGDGFDPCEYVQWLATFRRPRADYEFDNWGQLFEPRLEVAEPGPLRGFGCLFATAPDVVCDSDKTWARSAPWFHTLRRLGFPAGLVAQNGIEDDPRPWDEIDSWDCLFLGGDDAWKESQEAADCAREARRFGKWVHCGRTNSLRRIRLLAGCIDSVDGTYLAFGPDKNARKLAAWLDDLADQGVFFDV